MLATKGARLTIAISVLWLIVGGYWSFMRHSYSWRWERDTTRLMCGSDEACRTHMHGLYHPSIDWVDIAAEVAAGLIVIWVGFVIVRWIVGKAA